MLEAATEVWRAFITTRREPKRDRRYAEQGTELVRLDGYMANPQQESFRPPESTALFAVGRDPAHAPTPHRFYNSHSKESLAVMGWPFGVGRVPSALVIAQPSGRWNSMSPRVDIESGKQMSYGNMATLRGPLVSSYEYAKLMP